MIVPFGPVRVGVLNVTVGVPVYTVVSVTGILVSPFESGLGTAMADPGPGI